MKTKDKQFKIKIKDVRAFMKKELHLYASGQGKQFFIVLHAGPNVERYIVKVGEELKGFTKLGEAVRYFNEA